MRTRTAGISLALVLLALPVARASTAEAASASEGSVAASSGLFYTGDAYGTYANLGQTVVAGQSALVVLGCESTAGVERSNTVAAVNVAGVLTTGAINSTADTIASGASVASRTQSDVQSASLLGGVITASEVKAVSLTIHDSTGFHVSSTGSSLVNLVINGVPISAAPPPNTSIAVPGVGTVVLNEQISSIGANTANFTVNMIHVFVTAALPGVSPGTEIIVAHAHSDLELNRVASLDGTAYGSQAHLGNAVYSGRSAVVFMPCAGTGGKLKSNNVVGVTLPGAISTGTVTDTALGTVNATTASGELTSTVQAVALLTNVVTADVITADAHASQTGGVNTFSDSGSGFVNLVVNGQPVSGNVPANTKMSGGGLTIWLHRVIQTSNSIEVRMIEILVTGPNVANLATGTDIRVAVAEASVH